MNAAMSAAAIPTRDATVGDGIHVMWTPPMTAGYSIDGWDVRRRQAAGRPKVQCRQLSSAELELLHRNLRLRLPFGELRIREIPCSGAASDNRIAGPARAAIGTAPGRRCAAYELRLTARHRYVQVRIGVPTALAIALRDGKAVDARQLDDPSGIQTARFEDRDVDEVAVHCDHRATSLQVCLDAAGDPGADDASWAGATVVAHHLQLPLYSVNPAVGSAAQEDALAKSRLLPGEAFDEAAFRDVADLMNAAAGAGMPAWQSAVIRDEAEDPFIDIRSWSYAMAMLVHPAWRRMLAFAVLDPAAALSPGQAYDYRITGRFRRRDVEERVHGFHAVPRGTMLPTTFLLGDVALSTPEPATVELLPQPVADSLTAVGRKGIGLQGNPCLTIAFCAPVSRVVLDIDPGSALEYVAQTTGFLPGLIGHSFTGQVPAKARVTLEFADPVDTVQLSGAGHLYAVRDVVSAAGTSPDDVVVRHADVYGVVFDDTPRLPAPAVISTDNLQQPVLPGAASPPAALGFQLAWDPPAIGGVQPSSWPSNATTAPPSEAFGFQLERRQVDTGSAYGPLDPGTGPITIFGSRRAEADPPVLRSGIDLESVFTEGAPSTSPTSTRMTYDDALVTSRTPGPEPGSRHQYRIFTVDALGRRSTTATEGSIVRLEKRQPPPQPVGPPAPTAIDIGSGVRARVVQALDANLSEADRILLGSSENMVVIEWGWTESERTADPHAREFRVYWQPLTPDLVYGKVTGVATYSSGLYEMTAEFDRRLPANALRGRYLSLPDFPFAIANHPEGQSITLQIVPNAAEPQRIPGAAEVSFRPRLDGSELRPPAWAERSAVIPIDSADTYQFVFRDRLTLDADNPRARVWVGVSSADAEAYVDDVLPGTAANGGRNGNESAIVAAEAAARYLGRPEFTVPPPLPVVPEEVTDEPTGEEVTIRLDLQSLLPSVPAGSMYTLDRLNLDEVLGCIGVNADDTIRAALPDGSQTSYVFANPDDQHDLVTQLRTSTPAVVENRFLMDFVVRFRDELETMWTPASLSPFAFGEISDTLPAKAARYLHRIRLVDAAGHVSAGSAIAPQVVRTASLRSPAPPQLTAEHAGDHLLAQVRIRDTVDAAWVLLFVSDQDGDGAGAQLLRLPNARDRLPDDGLRLRLRDGTVLAPTTSLNAQGGDEDPPDRLLSTDLTLGADRRLRLWAVTVTRDGIPSRLAGPLAATTPPAPLSAPALTVTRSSGGDAVQWPAVAAPALLAVERSLDGGETWQQVSPWFASSVTSYRTLAPTGETRYRSTVRVDRGRRATGTESVVL
jgi:hypothetical protein